MSPHRYRAGLLAGTWLILLLLGGCSHTLQSTRLQQSPPEGLAERHELETTPFFPQERYQCGPAALATMLVARGVDVSPDTLTDQVYLPQRKGSVTVEMEAAARRYGMLVYPLAHDMEALLRELSAGNAVLVLQNLGLQWLPRWHYAVVVGYDLHTRELVLRSGTRRRYTVALGVFENTWRRGGYWARVIVPPGEIPATANALDYAAAALALEESRHDQAALASYRAATRRWPDSGVNWLAQGNLLFRQGDYREAEAAYRGGIAVSAMDARLWNNLAYVFDRLGCRDTAQVAVRCAMALEPEEQGYRSSLAELQASEATGGRCEAVRCPVNR